VVSQVQFGSLPASTTMGNGMPVEGSANRAKPAKTRVTSSAVSPLPGENPCNEVPIPQVFAHSAEFVALPGESEKLQWEIPLLMRAANGESAGFCGCIVFFSEQEARLVTVITMWAGRDQAKHCDEKRLKRLLEPYADRWLRVRRFVGFFPSPGDS
jgi:hypothetical protein